MAETTILPKPDGATYTIPDPGDLNWGQNVTSFLVAISNAVIPRSGSYGFTGDVTITGGFGFILPYFKSSSTNIATVGQIRLAVGDTIDWRNNANSANLALSINGSDQLVFNGSVIMGPSLGTADQVLAVNHTGTAQEYKTVQGTTNQVVVTGTSGFLTVSLPATVQITGLTLSGLTANSFLYSGTSGALTTTSAPTNGQLLIGSTGVAPIAATLTGTANQVTVTNGAGSITLALPQNIHTGAIPTFAGEILTGSLQLNDSGTHNVQIQAPTTITANYTLKMPTAQASGSQFLNNDGAGNLSWASAVVSGKTIRQIVSANATSSSSTTSNTYVSSVITATITPTSTSSTIIVIASSFASMANNASAVGFIQLHSSVNGDFGPANGLVLVGPGNGSVTIRSPFTLVVSHVPGSVSANTYTVTFKNSDNSTTTLINSDGTSTGNWYITLIDIL